MIPKLSIIIPCFNAERTLESTLQSVLDQDFQDWEVIIVNDGSIDNTEEIALRWAAKDARFFYFVKPNEGLGKTRNYGIKQAKGTYILPLDADNQLLRDFAQEAIAVLENDKNIGVVHGHAEYFGEKSGTWHIEKYNFAKILTNNYIDACAVYRKELWTKVGGYDVNMPFQGHEDWEIWLAFGNLQVNFYHLGTITFKYFVSNNSMIRSFSNEMLVANQDYIAKKYSKQYYTAYVNKCDELEQELRNFDLLKRNKKFLINSLTDTMFGIKFFKSSAK